VRLFVAIEAPEAWVHAAREVQRSLPDLVRRRARLTDPANLHITLKFIGEVEETELPIIRHTLAEALPPVAVDLSLGGLGTFGAPARTSVVWLAVGGDLEALSALARRADAAVAEALHLPLDDRAYHPHLTIARVRQPVPPAERRQIADAVRAMPAPPPTSFVAREAVLIHSTLGPDAARYACLGRWG
jgi:2'-5' RNA ligase